MDEYTWGQSPNQLLAARTKESGGLIFPMTDERQSIVGIFNEDKIVVEEYAQYDPDGRVRIRDNTDQIVCSEREMHEEPCHFNSLPHFGFTGAFRSQVTGLTLMGARWYSAQIGQFISPDPLWYIDAFDLYAYAAFDPVNRWDPTGLASTGLGNVFSSNEPRTSPADRLLPDRDSHYDGLIGSVGNTPDRRPTHRPGGGGRGSGTTPISQGATSVSTLPFMPDIQFASDVATPYEDESRGLIPDANTSGNGYIHHQVEVWLWEGVGRGSSSFGHASIVVDGTTYSFGPAGMTIQEVPNYEVRNLAFRSARVYPIMATLKEMEQMTEYLEGFDETYNFLMDNCVTPIRNALNIAGLGIGAPLTPDGARSIGGLGAELDSHSRVGPRRTVHTKQERDGGVPWSSKY